MPAVSPDAAGKARVSKMSARARAASALSVLTSRSSRNTSRTGRILPSESSSSIPSRRKASCALSVGPRMAASTDRRAVDPRSVGLSPRLSSLTSAASVSSKERPASRAVGPTTAKPCDRSAAVLAASRSARARASAASVA